MSKPKANPSQLRFWSDIECKLPRGKVKKKPAKKAVENPKGKPDKNYTAKAIDPMHKDLWADCLTAGCDERRKRPATHCILCMERYKRISDRVKANRKTAKLSPVELRGLSVRI